MVRKRGARAVESADRGARRIFGRRDVGNSSVDDGASRLCWLAEAGQRRIIDPWRLQEPVRVDDPYAATTTIRCHYLMNGRIRWQGRGHQERKCSQQD